MKTLIAISALVLFFLYPTDANSQGAKLEFSKETIDLGTLFTDRLEVMKIEVKFKNSGNQPLIVTSARGCCGTRILEWTSEPIMPGDTGVVVAEIRASPHPHALSRVITVVSNDPEGQKTSRIVARIEAPPTVFNPTPANRAPAVR